MRRVVHLLVLICCGASAADETLFDLRIKRAPIDSVLSQLSIQTGLQFARFSDAGDSGTLVGPLAGPYRLEEALALLLNNNGFDYRWADDRTIAVVQRKAATTEQESGPRPAVARTGNTVSPAFDAGTGASTLLEDVLVTARRVRENRQDVPLTVGVITAEELRSNDVTSTNLLERRIPGFTMCCGRATTFTFLRGVPGVLSYFAEVPTSNASDALLYDLQEVQVLKGPQGTLFGLASNGGAFLYEPHRPTTLLEGYAEIRIGEDARRGVEMTVNVPISEKLQIRLGGSMDEVDGHVRDMTQDKLIGSDAHWMARFSALFRPTADVENYTVVNLYEFDADDTAMKHLGYANPDGLAAQRYPDYLSYFQQQDALGHYRIAGSANPTFTRVEQLNAVNITQWSISEFLTLKNILGFVQRAYWDRNNADGTPLPISDSNVTSVRPDPTVQLSDEVQLQGRFRDGTIDLQLGANYQRSDIDEPPLFYNYFAGVLSGIRTAQTGHSNAVYGQVTFDASELLQGLRLTAGYRHTWDTLELHQRRYAANGDPVGPRIDIAGDFSAPSYTLSAAYQFTPDFMVYFTNSKGYSSGGFNPAVTPELQKYNPESLNSFEIGLKTQRYIGDIVVRTNAAAFYGLYDDIQALTNVLVQTPAGPVSSTIRQNAARAHTQGAELEFTAVAQQFQLDLNAGFQRAKYDEYIVNGVDLTYVPIYYTPEWKLAFNLRYEPSLPWDMSLFANYTWQDRMPSPNSYLSSRFDIPSFGSLNAGVSWHGMFGTGLSGMLLVTNVTNNWHTSNANHVYDTVGFFNYDVAAPRRWVASLRYEF